MVNAWCPALVAQGTDLSYSEVLVIDPTVTQCVAIHFYSIYNISDLFGFTIVSKLTFLCCLRSVSQFVFVDSISRP